jgi:hypothetical protein
MLNVDDKTYLKRAIVVVKWKLVKRHLALDRDDVGALKQRRHRTLLPTTFSEYALH